MNCSYAALSWKTLLHFTPRGKWKTKKNDYISRCFPFALEITTKSQPKNISFELKDPA